MEIATILAVLIGLCAILATAVKSGKNAQAIRAAGLVGIFAPALWVSVAALIWAVIEFFGISISSKKKSK